MITSVESRKCSVMQIGDLVCYVNRYYGIVTEVGNYWEYGEDIAGVAVYWIDFAVQTVQLPVRPSVQ